MLWEADGWTVRKLETVEDLRQVGRALRSCLQWADVAVPSRFALLDGDEAVVSGHAYALTATDRQQIELAPNVPVYRINGRLLLGERAVVMPTNGKLLPERLEALQALADAAPEGLELWRGWSKAAWDYRDSTKAGHAHLVPSVRRPT